MRRLPALLAVLAAAVLTACATTPPPRPPAPRPAPRPAPPPRPATAPAPRPPERPLAWEDLPGWRGEDHLQALKAVVAACRVSRDPDMAGACARLDRRPPRDSAAARAFIEENFQPRSLGELGLLTAYFAPSYEAREAPEGPFVAPVRPKPAALDLLLAAALADPPPGPDTDPPSSTEPLLPDRAAIESMPADDALAWMRPEDLFFLQLQGSGVLVLPDGRRLKAAFAGSNGRPFVGIARVMRDQGQIDDAHSSGDAIRAWLSDHRGPEADAVMRANPRYAFFTLRPDDGREPAGAAGVPLPPGRGLAVDPSRHAMGELFWIDASAPALSGAFPVYRRLGAALDTGAAIKGEVRADLYVGSGDTAGREAGRVRHVLRMYRLVPVPADPR